MFTSLNRLQTMLLAIVLCASANLARANPIGDFFKRVGNSIAHPNRKPPARTPKKTTGKAMSGQTPTPLTSPSPSAANGEESAPLSPPPPTATPIVVRAAASAPPNNTRRDLPYAVPVPNKPGFVTSPYAPNSGLVDVRGFASGTEVKDPYTGKIFLTP